MRRVKLSSVLSNLALVLIGIYVLFPIWGILRLSFDGSLRGAPIEFRFFPKEWSLEPFLQVLDRPYQSVEFMTLFRNSMYISILATVAAVILGTSMAYAFARFRFPGRQPGLFILLLTAVLPPIAFATPLYILLNLLQIRTTHLGLIIVYAAFAMPFCIWNMRAAFQSIPKELEEAAFLDGAGQFRTFLQVSLPLAIPSIAIAGIIAFLIAYSEFTIGWLFMDQSDKVTLAMAIYSIVQTGSAQPYSQLGSLAIIVSIPAILIFIIFQNTLLERMMFGSVDG
ncbi:MAG TPA: carbohydrate ABC transporter permease [Anaerolineales bacterium]|nr:carbohydrate ABC transporter permease [Anaerolineales bacterium]